MRHHGEDDTAETLVCMIIIAIPYTLLGLLLWAVTHA